MRFEKKELRKLCTVSNVFAAAYVVLIFTFLLIPSLGVRTKKDLRVDNRTAAGFPEVSVSNYRNFAPQFERWLADRFNTRKTYIRAWNYLLLHFFHESPHEQIVLGKDGFIFLAGHAAGKENENSLFRDLLAPDPKVVRETAGGFLELQPTFRQARPQLLFIAVATKHSLNYDKVPEKLRQEFRDNPSGIPVSTKITEVLTQADPQYAAQFFLDLYPEALIANRKLQLIPPKNFHWIPGPYTHLAAHRIAQRFGVTHGEFVLARENYDLRNTDSDLEHFFDFELDNPSWVRREKGDPVKQVPFTDKFPLKNCPKPILKQIHYAENPGAKGGRLLAIGDSFTPAICPDLARYFSQVTAIDFGAVRRYSPQLAKSFFREIINLYRPEYLVVVSHVGYEFADVIMDAINDPTLPLHK